jgi:hypothetical protein
VALRNSVATGRRRLPFDMQMTRSIGRIPIKFQEQTHSSRRHQVANTNLLVINETRNSFMAIRVHNSSVHRQFEMLRTKNSFPRKIDGIQVTQVTGRQLVTICPHFPPTFERNERIHQKIFLLFRRMSPILLLRLHCPRSDFTCQRTFINSHSSSFP